MNDPLVKLLLDIIRELKRKLRKRKPPGGRQKGDRMNDEIAVKIDVTNLDEAIEKANQLKTTLEEVKSLIDSLKA